MYSNKFSHFYDLLMGDYSSISSTLTSLVTKYIPQKSSILELGCGTGNMLKILVKDYKVAGLDNSRGMLEIAKKKVSNATFYQKDMTDFKLKEKVDGVICVFDTINHLASLSEWKKVFKNVHQNLNENGIFIFDINTKIRLDRLSKLDPYVGKLDKDTLTRVKFHNIKDNHYAINFQIFEDIRSEKPAYTEETIRESAFNTDLVKKALEQYFQIETMKDPIRKRITSKTGRIFFVCRKK